MPNMMKKDDKKMGKMSGAGYMKGGMVGKKKVAGGGMAPKKKMAHGGVASKKKK
jgi:hypothetical protein|tara:strand:- start:548 stop:709 length:162 start_codon:yes stop_codon:yes gene_type:complete